MAHNPGEFEYTELKFPKGLLRDFFAGCALMGILPDGGVSPAGVSEYTEESYTLADAMLAAREEKKMGGDNV